MKEIETKTKKENDKARRRKGGKEGKKRRESYEMRGREECRKRGRQGGN